MRTSIRKRLGAVGAALALLSTVTVLTATQGTAGADTTQNYACFSPLTSQYATFPLPLTGSATSPILAGATTDVTGLSVTIAVDASLVQAGIGAGVISFVTDASLIGTVDPLSGGDGVNEVDNTTNGTIDGTNTVEGSSPVEGATNITFFVVSDGVTATIYIDPTGTWSGPADNGNLVEVPSIPVTIPLADDGSVDGSVGSPLTFTSNSGGNIDIQSAEGPLPADPSGPPSLAERANAPMVLLNTISSPSAGGGVTANFYCWPGTSNGALDPVTGLPAASAGFTPGAASPITTVTVDIPATAPVANDDAASVGAGQSVVIDVAANDTDVNGDLDPTSVTIVTPPANAATFTNNGDGTVLYENDGTSGPDSFTYTIDDLDGTTATSNVATVNIDVLGDLCTAPCSLNQIIVTPVLGDVMTLQQDGLASDFIVTMIDAASIAGPDGIPGTADDTPASAAPITLNGSPQLAVGQLYQATVTNARGTDAGWDLTGQVTDFTDGTVAPNCPASDPSTWNNHCIPGDNLGWAPSASVAHTQVLGDVADVTEGTALYPPGFLLNPDPLGPTGLGSSAQTLCSAGVGTSGGTFTCDAGLAMSVPASAAAGNYTAILTLTLV